MPTTDKIKTIPVHSSNIQAIGYDPQRSVLIVTFTDGDRTYEYSNVALDVFELIAEIAKRGGSISSVFNLIRSNPDKYPYKRV
jgi:hypothetical protein